LCALGADSAHDCGRSASPLGVMSSLVKFVSLVGALLISSGSVDAQQELPCNKVTGGQCPVWDVSMIKLLADPTKYDGKRVRVVGYIHFEFEGNAIYLHKDDELHLVFKNGLWVQMASGIPSEQCQDTYALIEGTFRAHNFGHMELWSGAITDVTRCQKWGS
jgi:hypothetical protein